MNVAKNNFYNMQVICMTSMLSLKASIQLIPGAITKYFLGSASHGSPVREQCGQSVLARGFEGMLFSVLLAEEIIIRM